MGEYFREELAPKHGLDFVIGATEAELPKIQAYRPMTSWQNFQMLRKGPSKVPVSVDGFAGMK